MVYLRRLSIWVVAASMTLGLAGSVRSQEPPDLADLDLEEISSLPDSDSASVAAILATKPATPTEKVRAARLLAGLERPDLARRYLAEVLGADLDRSQLAAIHDRLGPALLVNLASRVELAPEGRQLSEAVLDAARAVREDAGRLDALVGQLSAADATASHAAMRDLLDAGRSALPVLIAALADPQRAEQHDMIRAALVRIGRSAVAPLVAALESEDSNLRAQAIRTLAGLQAGDAVPFFLASAADPREDPEVRTTAQRALATLGREVSDPSLVIAMLIREAREYLLGHRHLREDLDGNVTFWIWDSAGRPVAESRPAADARMAFAARLAGEAYRLAPEDEQARILYLVTGLESAARSAGIGQPLPIEAGEPAGIAAAAGPRTVEQVLSWSMDNGYIGAAVAAAQILGERGSALDLLCTERTGSPLIRAVRHDDRRLRFAAIQAVFQLDPQIPFAGSASVADAAYYLASSQGLRRALVAFPSTSESQRVGGYLAAMGFTVDTARTGRELMELALKSADYELILIDQGLQGPTVDFLLQQFRQDNRTARLPVGILAQDGQLARADHVAGRDPLAAAFPRPQSQDVAAWQVEQVLALAADDRVDASERLGQAGLAMRWLAAWSAGHKVFHLPRAVDPVFVALFQPELAAPAIEILANTGTPEAQKGLIDLASRWTQPLERRTAAVDALWTNTGKNGILLTTGEILLQYERYNQSEHLDQASRQVLGAILDCLETPARLAQEMKKPQIGQEGP